MSEAVLELSGIDKSYGGVQALRDVRLRLERGRITGLIGANGAGKSTLLKVIAGAVRPDSGTYRLRGELVDVRSPRDARDLGVSLVAQEPELLLGESVADNVHLGSPPRRGPFVRRRLAHEMTRQQLARLGAAYVDPGADVATLSPVEQRLVMIARGLAANPSVLVLDEPTAALPVDAANRLLPLLQQLAADGTAVVFVSHRLDEVRRISDTVVAMRNGAVSGVLSRAEVTRNIMIEFVGGRAGEGVEPRDAPQTSGAVVLAARGLQGSAVTGVDLTVHAGEIVGVGGLQGSGRSELLRLLIGAQPVTAGMVEVLGQRRPRSSREAAARGIGYLAEGRRRMALHGESVIENMTLVALRDFSRGLGFVDRRKQRSVTADMAKKLSLKGVLEGPIGSLSGGNQQKVFLGRWLLNNSRLLVLDEPTAGVDVGARAEFHALLRELAASGTSVLMASAEPEELALVCDRVYVMSRGSIADELTAPFDPAQVVASSYAGVG